MKARSVGSADASTVNIVDGIDSLERYALDAFGTLELVLLLVSSVEEEEIISIIDSKGLVWVFLPDDLLSLVTGASVAEGVGKCGRTGQGQGEENVLCDLHCGLSETEFGL